MGQRECDNTHGQGGVAGDVRKTLWCKAQTLLRAGEVRPFVEGEASESVSRGRGRAT